MPNVIYEYMLRGLSTAYEWVYQRTYGTTATPPDIKNDFIRIQTEQLRQLQNRLGKLSTQVGATNSQVNTLQGDLERRIQAMESTLVPPVAEPKRVDKSKLN